MTDTITWLGDDQWHTGLIKAFEQGESWAWRPDKPTGRWAKEYHGKTGLYITVRPWTLRLPPNPCLTSKTLCVKWNVDGFSCSFLFYFFFVIVFFFLVQLLDCPLIILFTKERTFFFSSAPGSQHFRLCCLRWCKAMSCSLSLWRPPQLTSL